MAQYGVQVVRDGAGADSEAMPVGREGKGGGEGGSLLRRLRGAKRTSIEGVGRGREWRMQASVGGIYLDRGGGGRGTEPLGVFIYSLTMGRCPHCGLLLPRCGFSRSAQPQVLHHGRGDVVAAWGNMGVLA